MNRWLVLSCLLASSLQAHPVAFQGALGVMGFYMPDQTHLQVAYSVTPRIALGVDYMRDGMMNVDQRFFIQRVNFLLKRWYAEDSQANVYAYAGVGLRQYDNENAAAIFAGGEADFETRTFYVSGRISTLTSRDLKDAAMTQFRMGVAPYVVDYYSLSTWLIGQIQYFPYANFEKVRFSPILRFFYKNVLWETGVSLQGMWSFNFMIHF